MELGFLRVGLLALSLASFGCSGDNGGEDKFYFEQADMEEALFGTWTGTLTPPGGTAAPLTLEIRSHDEGARYLTCAGSRSFSDGSKTPGLDVQCAAYTSLYLSATLVAGDGATPTDFDGNFGVLGTAFSEGELSLVDRTSDMHRVFARHDDGVWTSCRIWNGAEELGVCTLDARIEE